MMTDLLFVEDTEEYAEIAIPLLEDAGYNVDHARDYKEAMDGIDDADEVMTDLMIPEETGTGKKDLGYEVIEETLNDKTHAYKLGKDALENDDPDKAREFAEAQDSVFGDEYSSFGDSLDRMLRVHGSGGIPSMVEERIQRYLDDMEELSRDVRHYAAKRRKLEESEHNQPLGYRIAQEVTGEKPAVMTTNAYHHDEEAEWFFGNSPIPVIEGSGNREEMVNLHSKEDEAYWENAISRLEFVEEEFESGDA